MLKESTQYLASGELAGSPRTVAPDDIAEHRVPVIDLFAGAGGFSLGAARAGFNVVASVEIDRYANETHARNFPNSRHLGLDVATLSGDHLMSTAGVQGQRFGLIGGPPCQGFSEIGHRNPGDVRNHLFGHFMRLVREMRPAFFLAENVPGILNPANHALVKEALRHIPETYVVLAPHKVCAADFGAPTTRTRIFFAGYDPAQWREFSDQIFKPEPFIPKTTVAEALEGLPQEISPDWATEADGWRGVDRLSASYFADRAQGLIPAGVGEDFSIDALEIGYVSGCLGTKHTSTSSSRFGKLRPGEVDVVSKSVRLEVNGLCPTLRAGTGSDRGSYQAVRPIHPSQPRVITPREAARLQGFPDWYAFHPTKWHSFRQIGNSVSPLVAEGVLRAIYNALRGGDGKAKQVQLQRRHRTC